MSSGDSDWMPSGDENMSELAEGSTTLMPLSSVSSDASFSDDEEVVRNSDSSSVDDSDLDTFIMSTAQSAVLSRQRKKTKRDGLITDDVVMGDSADVSSTKKRKKKKKKTLATPIGRISPEAREILGRGHNAFLKRDYDSAIQLLEEAIRMAPGISDPFVTLGAIYEELGDSKRAIEALLVAVHLTPGDAELWKRVATMSQSLNNLDQAIYCYRRCVKAVPADEAEPYLRDLAQVFVQAGKFSEAATVLRKIFPQTTGEDALQMGTLLAKSLYNLNQKAEAMGVLEALMEPQKQATLDANVINMLAEVYLEIREWGRCYQLLTSVLDMDHLDDPEKCPADLVAKLAIAVIPSFDRHRAVCAKAVACIRSLPVESYSDLYLSVGDAFIANNRPEEALQLLDPALTVLRQLSGAGNVSEEESAGLVSLVNSLKGRIGKCKYLVGNYELGAKNLTEFIEFERSKNRRPDADSLVMLADAWRRLGRSDDDERAAHLLENLTYEDLVACQTLPAALPTTQRRKMLDQLRNLLRQYPDLGVRTRDSPGVSTLAGRFAMTFLDLLRDCELDVMRVARYRAQSRPSATTIAGTTTLSSDDWGFDEDLSTGQNFASSAPAYKLRRELDLESAEDVLGTAGFVEFLIAGSAVCAAAGKMRECAELLEVILHNKRKKWAQKQSVAAPAAPPTAAESVVDEVMGSGAAGDEGVGSVAGGAAGGDVVSAIERLSFSLAMEAGVNKIAVKYLRQEIVELLEEGGKRGDGAQLAGAVSTLTKLMWPRFSQREIIDQRSWLVRQAIRFPLEFALCLFCGHICEYSSNSRFASQEYLRAHRLRPEDPFPLLCLGSSLLSLSMSRSTADRQLTVLKAFAVLSQYTRLRRENTQQNTHKISKETEGEIHYNLGRAYHQLSLWTEADREYRRVLELVPNSSSTSNVHQLAAYNLSLVRMRNGQTDSANRIVMAHIVAR